MIRLLKMINKARICRPLVFNEEIKAPIKEKRAQKGQKVQISRFLTFLCNFCRNFDRHRELESSKRLFFLKKIGMARIGCPVNVYEKQMRFSGKKASKMTPETTKIQKLLIFNVFLQFL